MTQEDVRASCHTNPTIIGSSVPLRRVLDLATHAAAKNVKVAITGESGVGKDVLARFIHAHSPRASKPFVALNCAGIAEPLLESELFGHVRGSFTGAYRDKTGCFELAHTGTVFLDEIGDMGPRMQTLLLRFLETGEIRRVGSDAATTRVDVRVISATNRNLFEMMRTGQFREDLYYRVHVVQLEVPPLRDRREDIRPLVDYMAQKTGEVLTFTDETMRLLEAYRWPGNVRELQNVVEQVASFVSDRPVEPSDLPAAISSRRLGPVEVLHDRRRTIVDDLYDGLTSGELHFWQDVHRLFTERDLTRSDLRMLIRKALMASSGSYRGVLRSFGMPDDDYKTLLNFLAAHDCRVDSRRLRGQRSHPEPVTASRAASR